MSSNSGYAFLLACAVALVPVAGHGETGHGETGVPADFALKSVSVELPEGDSMFAAGPGAEVMNGNCVACHSVGMVLNQPAMSKAAWEAEVHKMIGVYKAPVAAKDVPAIVAYLDRIKGVR